VPCTPDPTGAHCLATKGHPLRTGQASSPKGWRARWAYCDGISISQERGLTPSLLSTRIEQRNIDDGFNIRQRSVAKVTFEALASPASQDAAATATEASRRN
jgi:hypothetical protein